MEYFERMNVRENVHNLRSRQLREDYPDTDWEEGVKDDVIQMDELSRYNKRLLHEGVRPGDNYDPENLVREAHNMSLLELKEGLTKAVNDKKAQALPIAI